MNEKPYTLRICTQTRKYLTLVDFFSTAFRVTFASRYGSNSTRKMSKVQLFVVGESLNSCGKMLQRCYAVFATSILNCVSFHCFLTHVELEKELFVAWNQVPWPCKGRSKTTTVYTDGLSNQEKKYAKNYIFSHS